ncbi:MAG: hypothetical protein L0216_05290 [Planctomycetales bacterium]|nr:hypothetical protein [Planctomycetales bacterium]
MRAPLAALALAAGCSTAGYAPAVPDPVLGTLAVLDDAPPPDAPVPVAVGIYLDPDARGIAYAKARDSGRNKWIYLPPSGRDEIRASDVRPLLVRDGDEVFLFAYARDGRHSEGIRARVPMGERSLRLGPAGAIRGRVLHGPSGGPLPPDARGRRGEVAVSPPGSPYAVRSVEDFPSRRFGAARGEGGEFLIEGVPPGRHRVVAVFPFRALERHAAGARAETVAERYGTQVFELPWAEAEVEVRAGEVAQVELVVPSLAEARERCRRLAAEAGWPLEDHAGACEDPDAEIERKLSGGGGR